MDESIHILIVDDDPGMCETLSDILGEEGYLISATESGARAIELVREHFYNVALVDMRLPDMNGLELLQEVKEICPETIVVIITAYATVKNAIGALNKGADAYITKPIDLDEVKAIIRKEVHNQQLLFEKTTLEKERRIIELRTKDLEETLQASESIGDISIQKLKDLNCYNESILRSVSSGILATDPSGVITTFNPGAEQVTGLQAEGVLGRRVDSIPEWKKGFAQVILSLLSTQRQSQEQEVEILKPSGKKIPVGIATSLLKSRNEKISGVIAVFRDISQTKELEAKLSAIHDFSKQISTLLKVEDVLNLTLTTVEEVLGHQYCAMLLADPQTGQLYSRAHRRFPKKMMKKLRLPLSGSKGITAWVAREEKPVIVSNVEEDPRYIPGIIDAKSEMAAPLKVGAEILGVIDVESPQPNAFSENDLTMLSTLAAYVAIALKNSLLFGDLARAKAELEQWNLQLENKVRERTQELQEAQKQLLRSERLATIGELAASFAHELRNPLGVLQNSAYFLDRRLKDADGMAKKHLAIMDEEISRSVKIISALVDFSQKREPYFLPTDLNQQIEEVLSRVSIPEGVDVVRELGDIPAVTADQEQLHTIFLNLISNGIQAMPEGGVLTLNTSLCNGLVEVKISDTGVGIPNENLGKIFEPLFATKSWGLGLGLPVTKKYIDDHRGTIKVDSLPNRRTTFTVRLPIDTERRLCQRNQ